MSRGFEKGQGEVPLVGMARFVTPQSIGGDLIAAESKTPAQSKSNAKSHGGFDEDAGTMTSVAMRILGRTNDVQPFAPNAAAKPGPAGVAHGRLQIKRTSLDQTTPVSRTKTVKPTARKEW